MNHTKQPQLYLKCEHCGSYFEYNGGKRRRWCTDKCKVAMWRKIRSTNIPELTPEQLKARMEKSRERGLAWRARKDAEV